MDVISIIERILGLVDKAYEVYDSAIYNKELCQILYERISAGEHRLKILKGNRRKLKKKFKNEDFTKNLIRYLTQVTNIKNLLDEVSGLKSVMKYLMSIHYKNEINEKIKRYDETINDLDLDINIDTLESVENLHEVVEKGFNDLIQIFNSMKENSESQGKDMKLIIEIVSGISEQLDKSNFKNKFSNKVIDINKLTDPSRDGDVVRGKVFKKLFNKTQPVACKPFEKKAEEDKSFDAYFEILRQLHDSNSVLKFYGMSYIDGKNLRLPMICLGLQFINECQIFHHDVRCENVLIIGPEVTTPKVTNFSLSKNMMDKISKKIPSLNDIVPWMAPEKLSRESSYTAKCEVYSFVPYLKKFDKDYNKIVQHIINGQRESLNFNESDEIQKRFKKIIYEAWNPKPELRPNMPDILKRLERLYKKYYPKINSHSKNRTDSDSDDSNYEDNYNFEFGFKKIETSTLEDGIKLSNQNTEESREKAWRYFEYHADILNNFKAKYYKGFYLLEGYGKVKKDPKKAKKLFKEAADNDITKAQYYYACLIAKEAANNPSLVEECIMYLEKAAGNESPDALFSLGNIYYDGKLNIQKDKEKGIKYYKMAAIKDHSEAIKKLEELKINIYN
ncbi:21556_t:CDS:2 [Gigaspora margarita]|uniref:21556_t:CDS:1 n=1 Tax=Gigaspora margarita TaxID=4874 RepID=A0ABN7VMC3_GIGMA|nr:21556_t:CDS:2 [Gigaspora margarita]